MKMKKKNKIEKTKSTFNNLDKSVDKHTSIIHNPGTLPTLMDNHIYFQISFQTWSDLLSI